MSNRTNVSSAPGGQLLTRSLLGLALTAAAATSQTWMVDVEGGDLSARGLAVAADGRIAVVRDSGDFAGVTLLDAGGELLASYDLASFDGLPLTLRVAAFLPDGDLVVAGARGVQPWVAELDPTTGSIHWSRVFDASGDLGTFEEMVVNDIGHVVLAAHSVDTSSFSSYAFVADVNPATDGTVHYRRDFGGALLRSMSTAQNGDLLLGSHVTGAVITRTSNWGNPIWSRDYRDSANMRFTHVVETTSGELMSVALRRTPAGHYDFVAFKTTAAGELIWNRHFETFPTTQFGKINEVFDVAATDDGGLVAAVAQPMPGGERAAALLRLAADGTPVWLRPFTPVSVDFEAVDLAVTPDGGFVVLGAAVEADRFRVARLGADGEAASCFLVDTGISDVGSPTLTVSDPAIGYTNASSTMIDVAAAAFGHAVTALPACGDSCEVTGGAYGSGTPGTGGMVPQLAGHDGFCLGYTPVVEITDVVGAAPGLLFIGFGPGSVPAMGGTFLLDPVLPILSFPLPMGGIPGAAGAGSVAFPLGTDLTPLVGLTLHMQAVFADPAGPTSKTLTNAASLVIG